MSGPYEESDNRQAQLEADSAACDLARQHRRAELWRDFLRPDEAAEFVDAREVDATVPFHILAEMRAQMRSGVPIQVASAIALVEIDKWAERVVWDAVKDELPAVRFIGQGRV